MFVGPQPYAGRSCAPRSQPPALCEVSRRTFCRYPALVRADGNQVRGDRGDPFCRKAKAIESRLILHGDAYDGAHLVEQGRGVHWWYSCYWVSYAEVSKYTNICTTIACATVAGKMALTALVDWSQATAGERTTEAGGIYALRSSTALGRATQG